MEWARRDDRPGLWVGGGYLRRERAPVPHRSGYLRRVLPELGFRRSRTDRTAIVPGGHAIEAGEWTPSGAATHGLALADDLGGLSLARSVRALLCVENPMSIQSQSAIQSQPAVQSPPLEVWLIQGSRAGKSSPAGNAASR